MKLDTQTLLIGGLVILAGAYIFKDQLCPVVPIPFICGTIGSVPWGGGTQETEAGTRYLAGSEDLPDAMYATGYY